MERAIAMERRIERSIMFANYIGETPFTSKFADDYFSNITGEAFIGAGVDRTFLSSLRALVSPRMKSGETVHLNFSTTTMSECDIAGNGGETAFSAALRGYIEGYTGLIHILDVNSRTEKDRKAVMASLDSSLTEYKDGYYRLEKVTDFYRKSFSVACYISPETRNVVAIVENLTIKKLHYLQVSIVAFMPWYFNQDDGISDIEMELVQSLRGTSADEYMRCIMQIAERYDLRSLNIKRSLSGFETRCERRQISQMESQILGYDKDIEMYNRMIGSRLKDRDECCIRLLGLKQKVAQISSEGDSEIMDYFLRNKKLCLEVADDDIMIFSAGDYLEYFDPDAAESLIENDDSCIYYCAVPSRSGAAGGVSKEDMRNLMRELFLAEKPRLRIRVCAAYQFKLSGAVDALRNHVFPMEFNGYLPNPHIDEFACMGNYLMVVNEMLKKGDYIGALEQCVASCKSLNFCDATVIERFMETMWRLGKSKKKFIELPDGTVVDVPGAIEWLGKEDGGAGSGGANSELNGGGAR